MEVVMPEFVLKLYVVGQTARSQRAIANLRQICESILRDRYELRIIDILEDPEAAEVEKILATPTLIKLQPIPQRRIIGDLSDFAKVLEGLDIRKKNQELLQGGTYANG